MITVMQTMAPMSLNARVSERWIPSEKRITVDMVPAPVVRGIEMGMTAVEIILEKGVSPAMTVVSVVDFIIPRPVLMRSSPPAIRKASMLIAKKFKIIMPVNMATVMVMNEDIVAIKQSLCCSSLFRFRQSERKSGIAGMLLATARRPRR
jgi:hypothetical protein